MSQFLLRHENSPELIQFGQINEFAFIKNSSIRLNSFNNTCSEYLHFYFILDGKFDWVINNENHTSINGSIASIPLCAQIIADIFNKPVSISQHNYSVGIGAYLLSATEMGIFSNLDEAAKSIVLPEQYFPKKNLHGIYMKHFEIFEMLSTKLKDDFENVVKLQ